MSFKCQSYMQFKALSAFLLQIGKMVLQSCLLSRDLSGKEGQDRGQEAGLSLFIVSSDCNFCVASFPLLALAL